VKVKKAIKVRAMVKVV